MHSRKKLSFFAREKIFFRLIFLKIKAIIRRSFFNFLKFPPSSFFSFCYDFFQFFVENIHIAEECEHLPTAKNYPSVLYKAFDTEWPIGRWCIWGRADRNGCGEMETAGSVNSPKIGRKLALLTDLYTSRFYQPWFRSKQIQ